jgi:hypothetical protein
LLELKGAGDVGASLGEQPGIWEGNSSFCQVQKIGPRVAICSILQGSVSCLLGGVRKARTNVALVVRIGSGKSEYGPISFRVGLVL